jgi:DNA-directed RNA polymerase subunit beta'
MEDVDKRLNPRIEIAGIEYCLPTNFELIIEDGQEVKVGDRIAYSAQSVDKNVDITSGIELVSKTLEAQRLQPAALLAREEGKVVSLVQSRGRRCVYVQGNDYNEYEVPLSSILKVRVGDQVRVGDEICEGHVNAQEVLEVFSETIAAQHVVNTLQKVYRSQGVRVDDRHFEVVVKRMIDRVEIYQSGDSDFLVGEEVSKTLLTEINKKITEMNGTPAMWRPRLMSIKRAALESDSWLSKASFMDTKRVLKASSIRGQIDLLNDIKPNVILGSSIPIGSNFRRVTE